MTRPALSQEGFLCDLPLPALDAILQRAGPLSRELCRALLDLYGPLPRLTPRGLETPAALLSALALNADRYLHLSALDLTHTNVVTDDGLLAVCTALPNLHTLRLPTRLDDGCTLTTPSVAAATSHLPRLRSLHVPFLADAGSFLHPANPLPEWPLNGCAHLQELTLPTPLAAATSTPALSCLTGLSKLAFQGDGRINVSHITSLAAQLPALVALELVGCFSEAVSQLRRLTRLTALKLSGWVCEQGVAEGELLHHVGTLTALRGLHLQLCLDNGTAEPGWLTRLTLLTCLRLDFYDDGRENALALDEAASSVPHLPALRLLHIADIDRSKDDGGRLSAAACARLASAAGSLRGLHLMGLSLPPSMFAEVLPQLAALTYLSLDCQAAQAGGKPFGWLAALTALRELRYFGDSRGAADGSVLPCQLLAGLCSMDALTLATCSFVDAPYLAQLCASMPQLTSLDLSDNRSMGGGLCALLRLTALEVLGLGRMEYSAELLEPVRRLSSLRRCYLGEQWGADERAAARAVLGRRVQAVFSVWEQDWHSGG